MNIIENRWWCQKNLNEEKIEIHCLRDLTRGGLSSALNEIASQAKIEIEIEENSIKVLEEVKGVCEILGFDPLYVANEGRFIAFVKKEDAERALNIMHSDEVSNNATIIGEVKSKRQNGLVTIKSIIGATRILDMLSGEQLPRIC